MELLPKKHKVATCCVNNCYNKKLPTSKISFFKLPSDADRRQEWLKAISREDLTNRTFLGYCVCEKHFMKIDIVSNSKRKILKRDSVPTLHLPESGIICPKPTKKIFNKACNHILSKEMLELVIANVELKYYSGKENNPSFLKKISLTLYFSSQHAYKALQKPLCLPSCKKIVHTTVEITTSINEHFLSTFKSKVETMHTASKNCSMIVDTISLREGIVYNINEDRIVGFHEIDGKQVPIPATTVLVVFLRGIYENWIQPVGFALLSEKDETTSDWISKLMERLIDLGLNIRNLISNYDSTWLDTDDSKDLQPTKQPYFFIKEKKIYNIFNLNNLMKITCDSIALYEYSYVNNSVIKMEYISTFLQHERTKSWKLTSQEQKQFLNKTVARGISTLIDFNIIDENAKSTVEFIMMMSKLYNLLNCENFFDEHVIINLKEIIDQLLNVQLINKDTGCVNTSTHLEFIHAFIITIKSIINVLDDLKKEGYNILPNRIISNNVMESFIAQTQKTKVGDEKPPKIIHFLLKYQKSFYSNLLKPNKHVICSLNLEELFANTLHQELNEKDSKEKSPSETSIYSEEQIPSSSVQADITVTEPTSNTVKIKRSDYKNLSQSDINSGFFVCGYLLKKCLDYHGNCWILKNYCKLHEKLRDNNNSKYGQFMDFLMYASNSRKDALAAVPCDEFVEFVENMELTFHNVFSKPLNSGILKTIYNEMESITFRMPCPCFPLEYLKKMYIRMRIYHAVKSNNINLRKRRRERFYEELLPSTSYKDERLES